MIYDFGIKLREGQHYENMIIAHFSKEWEVIKATSEQQRKGFDFVFTHKTNRKTYTVELKSDTRASSTQNAFIETFSVFPKKRGWAYTCQADYLFYFLPKDRLIYILTPKWLRSQLPRWSGYQLRKVTNNGYETHGLLVPLKELERTDYVLSI